MLKKILAALAALGAGLSTILYVLLKQSKEERKVEEAEKRVADAERIAETQTAAREAVCAVAKKKTELEAEDEELVERSHSGDSIDSFNAGLDLLRQQSERGNKRNSRSGSSRT